MTQKTLKIALPAPGFFPNLGGAEIGLHNVAKRLKALGHEPVVISSWRYIDYLRKHNISFSYDIAAFPPFILSRYDRAPNILQFLFNRFYDWVQKKYKFDIWHVNYAFPTGISVIRWQQGNKNRVPFLVQSVGDDIQRQPEIGYGMRLNPQIDNLVRTWLPKADLVIAVSESVYQEFLSVGVSPHHIKRVTYGVDVKRFAHHIPHETKENLFHSHANEFIFLCVGRNHPKKNFLQPLKAIQILKSQGISNFKLVYVGTGVHELKKDAENLGVASHVLFCNPPPLAQGQYDDIPSSGLLDYYKQADCFVMPSITETFGIVIAEAMASGLPVISADAPGCRDVTGQGQYALTYDLSDDQALAAHMKSIMIDSALRQKYQDLSKERVIIYDWDVITNNYLDCYLDLLRSNRS